MRASSVFLFFLLSLPISPGQIPTDGLVAYWPFNGSFQEEGPSRLHSYPFGSISLAEDRFGQPRHALSIDSIHSCLLTDDAPSLHVHSFSWSFWIRVDTPVGQGFTAIIAKRIEKPDNRFSIAIYNRDCSLNSFVCNQTGDETYVRSSLWGPRPGIWHHVAVTGDYLTLDYVIYSDGVPIGRVDLNVSQAYDNNPLSFGNQFFHGYSNQNFFNGRIDDIRLYDRALNREEVRRLASERPEGKPLGDDWMKKELPDGRYVALFTEHDKISPQPFLFELQRRRPLWQNAWFIGLCLSLTCLLTFWAFRVRYLRAARLRQLELEKLKAIEQERSRIARDLHDDLGSGLSAIGLLTEIARQKSSDPALDVEIQKMAATSTELSRKIREIIWMVSARFDNLENLVSYLNHFAVELFADSTTELEIHLPSKIPTLALNGEQRRTFFHAVKTALLHLRRHGPSRVILDFSVNSPVTLVLKFPFPDVFSGELETGSDFSLILQKLKETGSAFYLEKGEDVQLHFTLHAPVK